MNRLRAAVCLTVLASALALAVPSSLNAAPSLANLFAGKPQLMMPAPGNETVIITVPIINQGSTAAVNPAVRVGRRENPEAPWIYELLALGDLAAGAGLPVQWRLPLRPETAKAAMSISLDPGNLVPESDESDNELMIAEASSLVIPPSFEPLPRVCASANLIIRGRTGPGWEIQARSQGGQVTRAKADPEGGFAVESVLAPGLNLLSLRALLAGAWPSREVALPPVFRDVDPPQITVTIPAEGEFYRQVLPRIEVRDETAVQTETTLDDRPYRGGTVEDGGEHSLRVTATDAAGNASSLRRHFYIDRTPPELSLAGIAEDAVVTGAIKPALRIREANLRSSAFWIDGYLWRDNLSLSVPGRHELTARAEDRAGNVATLRMVFTIDAEPSKVTPLTEAAIALALPARARIMMTKSGSLAPGGQNACALIFSGSDHLSHAAIIEPGNPKPAIWTAPISFASPDGGGEDFCLDVVDLDDDGVCEVVAEGPDAAGTMQRLVVMRWQAGAWAVIANLTGRDLLFLAGPVSRNLPVILASDGTQVAVWRRSRLPSGQGAQFVIVPGVMAKPDAIGGMIIDPGWTFLRPLLTAAERQKRAGGEMIKSRAETGKIALALLVRADGYYPMMLQDGRMIPLASQAIPGEIAPAWRGPSPDGLFQADFDQDGVAEPYFTLKQGEAREIHIFDVVNGLLVQIFQGRVNSSGSAGSDGLHFWQSGERTLISLGNEGTGSYIWNREQRQFLLAPSETPAGDALDLLSTPYLVPGDWVSDLW